MTQDNQEDHSTESGFKLVTISFTEQASLVVRAEDDDTATKAVLESFSYIPDLKVILIEDAPEDTVREARMAHIENTRTVN